MKNYIGLLIVLLFGLIASIDLLHPGFALTHDGQDHIVRIANFYQNLSQGILIPRWAENLNKGYGHPVLEFLYPLPSYIASLFHFLGLSFVNSTKLVFALGMVISGLAMYWFVRSLWGENAGVVSGILYMYAPYRFVDVYVRGDIGENLAFVFVPLVFLGFFCLSRQQTIWRILFAAIMTSCLILSHNAVALMVLPLVLLYSLYLLWQKKFDKKIILIFFIAFIIGFLLCSFFWFPALFEGQYTLRNIVTKGQYVSRFVTLSQLLYGAWSYGESGMFTVQLGLLHWVALFVGVIISLTLWKKSRQTALLGLGLFIVTFAAFYFMLPMSNVFWSHILLLQNFQFPWRFLVIPVFTTSILGGLIIGQLPQGKKIYVSGIVCLALLFLSKDYMHAKSYVQKPESFFTGVYYGTTDTGESSPIWSVRFMEAYSTSPLETIQGNTTDLQKLRLITKHVYSVTSVGQSRLLENTLYFPGWKITVDGKGVPIQFQDPKYRGLMTFFVPNGAHTVIVSYNESKLRLVGDLLSVIGVGAVGFLFLTRKKILL